jgi:surfeit locus 1 family protein
MTDGASERRDPAEEAGPRRRSSAALATLGVCALLLFAGLVALGTWQLQRLQWKVALIERVEQRVHAAPVPAPGPERWPQVAAESDEYRRVSVSGTFLYDLTTRVQATTDLGSGYWLLTPMRTSGGYVVLVNRGFIPLSAADRDFRSGTADANDGQTAISVTGLLRVSEPGGAFLRYNDPAADRWYSRDVQAIAAARGLSNVAPYFVDAEAAQEPAGANAPVGGLTVISFNNNHLVYALTWYALALMVGGGFVWLVREERRMRRARSAGAPTDSSD